MKILIMTEAGVECGFGHLTRCLALSQAFEKNGLTPEIIVNGDESIRRLLKCKRCRIFNWLKKEKMSFGLIKNSDIVIIDSYLAGYSFYEKVSKMVKIPVYIDDNKRIDYPDGVVLNGGIHAENIDYPRNRNLTYLIGINYSLLREQFWHVSQKIIRKNIETIMICIGGTDKRKITSSILKFIDESYPELIKNVVIGKRVQDVNNIENLRSRKIKLKHSLDAEEMKKIMLESDIAISAAGQTLNELARVGIPTIAICIDENQFQNVEGWQKSGFLEGYSWYDDRHIMDKIKNSIDKMSQKDRLKKNRIGAKLIDGQGARRTAEKIIKIFQGV